MDAGCDLSPTSQSGSFDTCTYALRPALFASKHNTIQQRRIFLAIVLVDHDCGVREENVSYLQGGPLARQCGSLEGRQTKCMLPKTYYTRCPLKARDSRKRVLFGSNLYLRVICFAEETVNVGKLDGTFPGSGGIVAFGLVDHRQCNLQ